MWQRETALGPESQDRQSKKRCSFVNRCVSLFPASLIYIPSKFQFTLHFLMVHFSLHKIIEGREGMIGSSSLGRLVLNSFVSELWLLPSGVRFCGRHSQDINTETIKYIRNAEIRNIMQERNI